MHILNQRQICQFQDETKVNFYFLVAKTSDLDPVWVEQGIKKTKLKAYKEKHQRSTEKSSRRCWRQY